MGTEISVGRRRTHDVFQVGQGAYPGVEFVQPQNINCQLVIHMLPDLPYDIQLRILKHLDVFSISNLSLTCESLHALLSIKTVWLDAFEQLVKRRPVPLGDLSIQSRSLAGEVSLERLKAAVIRAARIERCFEKPVIKPTYFTRLPYNRPFDETRISLWAQTIETATELLTMAYDIHRWFICIFKSTNKFISFETRYDASHCTVGLDNDRLIMVFNRSPSPDDFLFEGHPTLDMEVHQIDLARMSHDFLWGSRLGKQCHYNFVMADVVGCIFNDRHNWHIGGGGTYKLLIYDWKRSMHVTVDTGVEGNTNFTASTTKDALWFSITRVEVLDTWFYNLSSLRQCIKQQVEPDTPSYLPPDRHLRTRYTSQGISPRAASKIISISRSMWNGRRCIFTILPKGPSHVGTVFTYSLISERTMCVRGAPDWTEGESPGSLAGSDTYPRDSGADATVRESTISRRSFIYEMSPGLNMYRPLQTPAALHLYGIGHHGANAAWVDDLGNGKRCCRMARFDCQDDAEEGSSCSTTSLIELNGKRFTWNDVNYISLDDGAGILTCVTQSDIWNLRFD